MENQLNTVIQEGLDMEALMSNDKFKSCILDKFDELSKNLVKNYATKSEDIKTRIEYQMLMISGLSNFCEGTVQAGKMAQAEQEAIEQGVIDG